MIEVSYEGICDKHQQRRPGWTHDGGGGKLLARTHRWRRLWFWSKLEGGRIGGAIGNRDLGWGRDRLCGPVGSRALQWGVELGFLTITVASYLLSRVALGDGPVGVRQWWAEDRWCLKRGSIVMSSSWRARDCGKQSRPGSRRCQRKGSEFIGCFLKPASDSY